ncbi:MAG: AMP-binding protein, partial [Candidatus Wallbacteria bacterium]|nr:AMP-binding protein [Candidatus Wallbacteria bacterium]
MSLLISRIIRRQRNGSLIEGYETRRAENCQLVYEKTSPDEFCRSVGNIASALYHRLGIRKGDRVVILSENRRQWLKFFLAVLDLGAIAVPLDVDILPERLQYILENSGAVAALCSAQGCFDRCEPLRKIKNLILLDSERTKNVVSGPTTYNFQQLIEFDLWEYPSEVEESDPALLIYTAGTSGEPKGILLSHQNLAANVEGIGNRINVGSSDNIAIILPLHHAFPLTVALTALTYNASVTLASSHKRFSEIIRGTSPSIIIAVPLMLEKMQRGIFKKIAEKGILFNLTFLSAYRLIGWIHRIFGFNLSHLIGSQIRASFPGLRCFVSGGARLSPQLQVSLHHLDIPVINGYGTSELSPVVSVQPFQEDLFYSSRYYLNHAGECGPLLHNLEGMVDQGGCLLVSGPSVMLGYFNDPGLDSRTIEIRNGRRWFNTSDVVEFRADRSLMILGRCDNVIKLNCGKRVSAESIREKIRLHPLFLDAWPYAAGGDSTQDSIRAAVLLNPDELSKLGLTEADPVEKFQRVGLEALKIIN